MVYSNTNQPNVLRLLLKEILLPVQVPSSNRRWHHGRHDGMRPDSKQLHSSDRSHCYFATHRRNPRRTTGMGRMANARH